MLPHSLLKTLKLQAATDIEELMDNVICLGEASSTDRLALKPQCLEKGSLPRNVKTVGETLRLGF